MAAPYKTVQKMEFDAADAPTTKTWHGLTIKVNNQIVGRVQSWTPTAYSREGQHVYELNNDHFGRPVDYVPGIATGFEISFSRVELWFNELELALGYGAVWEDLTDQTRPFLIEEWLYRGQDVYRVWHYRGCWFRDRNEETAEAQGSGVYTVNAVVAYVRRERIQ